MGKYLDFDRDAAVNCYLSGESVAFVARKFSVGHRVMKKEIASRGIDITNGCMYGRQYYLNERYFQNIDSEDKAYWLGFLTADGCVYQKNSVSQISLKLKASDASHVQKFALVIGTNKKVTISSSNVIFPQHNGDETKRSWHSSASIVICSKLMADDLSIYGVSPRKSLIAISWKGPEHLIRHYWRGVVDGDGWICDMNSSARENYHSVGLCGSFEMMNAYSKWIKDNLGLSAAPVPKGKIYCVTYGGTFAPQSVAKLLYSDAIIYLDRKKTLADSLVAKQFDVSKFAPRVDITDQQVIDAYRCLRSVKKVGKQIGIDARTVSTRLKKNGIQLRKSKWH